MTDLTQFATDTLRAIYHRSLREMLLALDTYGRTLPHQRVAVAECVADAALAWHTADSELERRTPGWKACSPCLPRRCHRIGRRHAGSPLYRRRKQLRTYTYPASVRS